ncbi:FMN-binding protein [Microbacterium radiodurans]|uniref:FMN-binding protein n=1 Tax=Microbacterium radiodurans TaxID=661398 RepID=A0A5J5IRU3_9MICO|nr:FMN-binding protein [Microbacterium radiodurans]KAA9086598.1 FMN-binding protein [Microbacterium radiodurans]
MIRTTAVPRSLRVTAAAASVAGLALLAGCAGQADAEQPVADDAASSTTATPSAGSGTDSSGAAGSTDGAYTDGSYTAEGTYQTPEGPETITVTLTVASDVVTEVEVVGEPTRRESKQYQSQFIGGIDELVVGKDLADVSVDRVAGSSLTSGGFNAAVEEIRTDAAA